MEAKARKSKQIWSKFTKGIEPFDHPMKYLEKTLDNSDSTIYQSRSSHDLAASMSSQLQFAHKLSDAINFFLIFNKLLGGYFPPPPHVTASVAVAVAAADLSEILWNQFKK